MKTDEYGFHYFEKLPQGSKRITLDDWKNKIFKIGKNTPFVVLSPTKTNHYELYRVTGTTAGINLYPFIKEGRAWFIDRQLCPAGFLQ